MILDTKIFLKPNDVHFRCFILKEVPAGTLLPVDKKISGSTKMGDSIDGKVRGYSLELKVTTFLNRLPHHSATESVPTGP